MAKRKMKQVERIMDRREASLIRAQHRIRRMKKLLRDLHPHVLALSVTDEAREFKLLLARTEELM